MPKNDAVTQAPKKVFVSVKHEIGNWIIVDHMLVRIPEGSTINQRAKHLRKTVWRSPAKFGFVNRQHIPPSEFAWAVYESKESETPILHSDNWINSPVVTDKKNQLKVF